MLIVVFISTKIVAIYDNSEYEITSFLCSCSIIISSRGDHFILIQGDVEKVKFGIKSKASDLCASTVYINFCSKKKPMPTGSKKR